MLHEVPNGSSPACQIEIMPVWRQKAIYNDQTAEVTPNSGLVGRKIQVCNKLPRWFDCSTACFFAVWWCLTDLPDSTLEVSCSRESHVCMFGSGTSESLDFYWKYQVLPKKPSSDVEKKTNQVTNIMLEEIPPVSRETCKQGWRMKKIDSILPNDQRSTISWTTTPLWELLKVLRKRTGCENRTGQCELHVCTWFQQIF